jgi:DNA replication protein DnaC
MEEKEKQRILEDLLKTKGLQRDIETIWGYIERNEISFDEMKKVRCLFYNEQNSIEIRQQKLEMDRRVAGYSDLQDESVGVIDNAETNFWNECHLTGTKQAYIKYLTAYPNGLYKTQSEFCLVNIFRQEAEYKARLFQEMKDYPEHFDNRRVQELLDKGIIDRSDLFEEDIITEPALNVYLNPPFNQFRDQSSWEDLPDIPKDKTDIYFLGISGSGKSCILAGLLYAADRKGILCPDIKVRNGGYMYELINCIRIGYVPKATVSDFINCLSFSLQDEREHPLNVIEMCGDSVIDTYYESVGDDRYGYRYSTLRQYLKNKNRKLLFFVIDYRVDLETVPECLGTRQANILTATLTILAQDGILNQTDGIGIIINKSDYMPTNEDRTTCAMSYLDNKYKNFMAILSECLKCFRINKATGYNPFIIPFSLGRFMLGRTFIYNQTDSDTLINAILSLSRTSRRKKTICELINNYIKWKK